MTVQLWIALGGFFIAVALLSGALVSALLAGTSTERRRLRQLATPGVGALGPASFGGSEQALLTERINPRLERIAKSMPKSPKELSRLRRRLASAGIHSFGAALLYTICELVLPVLFAAPALLYMAGYVKWVVAAIAGMIGYMIPGLVL